MALELAPIELETFKIMSAPYETFVTALRGALAGDRPDTVVGPKTKVGRPVLAKQTPEDQQPPRWIHVQLNGKDGVEPKVAIRNDNAYIVGFTNSKGDWFQLSKTGTKVNLVNDKKVTMLGFDGNYNTLVKGGVNGLTALDLSKHSTAKAAASLWNHTANKLYGDDLGKPDDELKKAIATLCVALCEAARFTPVSKVISKGWGTSSNQVSITQDEVSYIKEWGDLSTQLLKWKKEGYKNDKELFKKFVGIRIEDGENALDVVQLVKQISRSNSLLAWLECFLGLLVKKLQQEDTTV